MNPHIARRPVLATLLDDPIQASAANCITLDLVSSPLVPGSARELWPPPGRSLGPNTLAQPAVRPPCTSNST